MKVTWPLVGAAALLLVGVVALQGFGGGLFGDDKMAAIDRPEAPCPAGWNEHPAEGICMVDEEVCRAWIDQPRGTRTETLECPVVSRDGAIYFTFNMGLHEGQAQITIRDGSGNKIHEETLTNHEGFRTRSGAAGEWTLNVSFSQARGSGSVYLWG